MATRVRRSAGAVEAAIRQATLAELDERGYGAMTFEGVARRAGTSKPVVYRRYSDRAALVLDAIRGGLATVEPEATGSLRGDLVGALGAAAERAAQIGPETYRGLAGEASAQMLAQLDELGSGVFERVIRGAVENARSRDELGTSPIPPIALRAPAAVLRDHIVFGAPLDIDALVDHVCLPLFRTLSQAPTGAE